MSNNEEGMELINDNFGPWIKTENFHIQNPKFKPFTHVSNSPAPMEKNTQTTCSRKELKNPTSTPTVSGRSITGLNPIIDHYTPPNPSCHVSHVAHKSIPLFKESITYSEHKGDSHLSPTAQKSELLLVPKSFVVTSDNMDIQKADFYALPKKIHGKTNLSPLNLDTVPHSVHGKNTDFTGENQPLGCPSFNPFGPLTQKKAQLGSNSLGHTFFDFTGPTFELGKKEIKTQTHKRKLQVSLLSTKELPNFSNQVDVSALNLISVPFNPTLTLIPKLCFPHSNCDQVPKKQRLDLPILKAPDLNHPTHHLDVLIPSDNEIDQVMSSMPSESNHQFRGKKISIKRSSSGVPMLHRTKVRSVVITEIDEESSSNLTSKPSLTDPEGSRK